MPKKDKIKTIEDTIKSFLEKESSQNIKSSSSDLVKQGIISSFHMFQLIDFIEKRFKVKVDILNLNPDNFNSLKNISKQINIWTSK